MNTSISKMRKEIKLDLTEKNTRTIVDVIRYRISLGRPLSIWMGVIITFLLTIAISLIINFLSGELSNLYRVGINLPPGSVSLIIFSLFTSTASMIFANAFLHRVVAVLRDQVIDLAESPITLDEIRSWVELIFGKPVIATIIALLGGVAAAIYAATVLGNLTGTPFRFSLLLSMTLFSIQSTVFVGVGIAVLILALRMWNFELRLFESDPASSEVVSNLSGLFSSYVYLVAVYGTILTFGVARTGLVTYYVPLMFLFWTPIIAIFVASQVGLAKLIQRAKWKTLNRVQKKIAALQKEQALPNNVDRESITWLLDYHERVRSTRNSALDLSSWFNFLNSLLLPLIAFVVGNIDTLLRLVSGRP